MFKRWVAGALAACAMLLFSLPAEAASPASTAKKLFHAWLRADRAAAAKVATPAAVKTIFAYPYRAPDGFAGCAGNACRFRHTSVSVVGGLDGILMIVSGKKVVKVYESRHLTKPSKAALWLFGAWKAHDRNRGLEVADAKAVNRLFRARFDPHGVPYTFQGCTGTKTCAWSYEGGALIMHMYGSASRGYAVAKVTYIAD